MPNTDAPEVSNRVAARTNRAAAFATALLSEHVMAIAHGPPRGPGSWLLPLADGQGIKELTNRLQALVGNVGRDHLLPSWSPANATTLSSLATMCRVLGNPSRLFDTFHPQAELLPLLTHAFLSARGPRTVCFTLFTRYDFTGADARTTYGAHKEPGIARRMALGGLAAVTGDTITPVTLFPFVHRTWDDPDHPDFETRQTSCDAAETLQPFRLEPDGSIAAFASHQFELLQQVRTILKHAAKNGSQVCEAFAVDPLRLLAWTMPKRIISGRLSAGSAAAYATPKAPLLPGLSAELFRAADRHGVELLAYAFDHTTDSVHELLPELKKLSIVEGSEYYAGFDLAELLSGNGRSVLSGLDEISPSDLAVISGEELARHCEVAINTEAVRYFRVEAGRLRDRHGASIRINLLVRLTSSTLVSWSTTLPVSGGHANPLVLTSELQLGAELGTAAGLAACIDRYIQTFAPHKVQSPALTTRTYTNIITMIANQGAVAHLRSVQAGRPYPQSIATGEIRTGGRIARRRKG